MPPECQAEHLDYNTKLDIFSFGVLILYTFIGDRPGINAIPPPTKEEMSEGKVELMRRNPAIHKMGENHSLHPLVMRCLNDHPERRRPTAEEVGVTLAEARPLAGEVGVQKHTTAAEEVEVEQPTTTEEVNTQCNVL